MLRKFLVLGVLAAAVAGSLAVATSAFGHGGHSDLDAARRATARFQSLDAAKDARYKILVDAQKIACIDMPGSGAMGVHYVNGDLVGDTVLNPRKPEAVVYEPKGNGRSKLVALEYVVFQEAWDAAHAKPPSLFGQEFSLTASGNRFGLPAFYSLHAWVWKHNPSGTFAMWNPRVSCTAKGDTKGNSQDDDNGSMNGMHMGHG
jgi:hypothetical protein